MDFDWNVTGAFLRDQVAGFASDQTALLLDRKTGKIAAFFQRSCGRNLLAGATQNDLFSVEFLLPGNVCKTLSSSAFDELEFRAEKERLTLTFRRPGFTATVTVAADEEGLLHCRFSAESEVEVTVEKILFGDWLFPVNLAGKSGTDEGALLLPVICGEQLVREPWSKDYTKESLYPRMLDVQLFALYTPDAGIYLATYDGACHYKKFCTQMTQGKAVRFHLEHFLPAEARRKIEIPYDIVLGTFTGEWHDAADLYKKWAVKQRWCAKKLAERDDVPKILKEGAALFAVPFYHEIMIYNLYDFNVVPRLPAIAAAFQKATGMAHVGIIPIGWENRGAWAGINYFPAKPSEEAWQTVSRELKKDGNFLMMMPGGFNWIVRRRADGRMGPGFDDTEQFEREKDMLIAKKDGQPSRAECYDIPHCYIGTRVRLCRGSQKARETVAGIFHHLAEMGCSLIQFDQEDGGAQAEPCYRKGHGHRIGYTNEYTEKFLEMCENVIRENRKIDPDFGVTMENLGEAVIPVSAAMWGRQCSEIDEALHHTRSTALFSYLYHEYQICLGDGFSMGQGLSAVQGSAELRAFRLANSVVRGLLPTVYMEQVELDADDAWTQKVSKAFCAFCRPVSRFTEYLVLGTTRRAPQLQCADQKVWHYVLDPGERLPDGRETYGNVRTALYRKWVKRPAVVAGSFEAADGSLGTILINATDLEQRVSFRLSGGWQSIEMYDGGRAPLPAANRIDQELALPPFGIRFLIQRKASK